MPDLHALAEAHCRASGLEVSLSADMPAGYETAFGTYVPQTKTLHLNEAALADAPPTEALFTLYHELRHAELYQHPERFSQAIRESLPYVILYNGQCFRQTEQGWRSCRLPGNEAWFTQVYLSLPYELDANEFACRRLEQHGLDASEQRRFWLPAQPLLEGAFPQIFREIDAATNAP